jgi:hypothetical protein
MPEEDAAERAREDEREGKSPSTQAGEFVREEMEHIREGEHGARSPEQSNRHRTVGGAAGWRKAASPETRQAANETPSETRSLER